MCMDISILLAFQDFRNGPGAFLAAFLAKMTWLCEFEHGDRHYGAALLVRQ